jgi:hypothetical protein
MLHNLLGRDQGLQDQQGHPQQTCGRARRGGRRPPPRPPPPPPPGAGGGGGGGGGGRPRLALSQQALNQLLFYSKSHGTMKPTQTLHDIRLKGGAGRVRSPP